MGVMSSPVLAINGKPAMTGSIFDVEKIKKIINDHDDDSSVAEKKSGCSCGGNC